MNTMDNYGLMHAGLLQAWNYIDCLLEFRTECDYSDNLSLCFKKEYEDMVVNKVKELVQAGAQNVHSKHSFVECQPT